MPITAIERIAMRPGNALGYRRHPFRQPGDVDHARRVCFPTVPQQLSAGLASGSRAVISELEILLGREPTDPQARPDAEIDPKPEGDGVAALAWRTSSPLPCRRSTRHGLTDWLLKPSTLTPLSCRSVQCTDPIGVVIAS